MPDDPQDSDDQEESAPWEERSLNLLRDSNIDREFSKQTKNNKKVWKSRKVKYMVKPMVMPEAILDFLDDRLRENAIRYLSTFLVQKREEDPDNYCRAGFLMFNSCATMTVLLQEIIGFYRRMVDDTVNVRSIKRLANVLTLFQSIAANNETRQKFVESRMPNFLIPLIQFESTIEVFDNIRAMALSIFGILCQAREPKIVQWTIESGVIAICHRILDLGTELNKVIAMHILEAIFQANIGISYICNPTCDHPLRGLMETWDNLVKILAADQDYSPRLLFHIIRCYTVLCAHTRGYNIVMTSLPDALTDDSFHGIKEEFPVIKDLLHQLLLCLGKVTEESVLETLVHVSPAEVKTNKYGLPDSIFSYMSSAEVKTDKFGLPDSIFSYTSPAEVKTNKFGLADSVSSYMLPPPLIDLGPMKALAATLRV